MDRPLRILAPEIALDPTCGGGRYDYEQLGALARLGHQVLALIPQCNRLRSPIPPGVEVRFISGQGVLYNATWNPVFFPWLLWHGLRWRPDILRIHSPYCMGIAGILAGRLLRRPVVGLYHHLGDSLPGHRFAERTLARYFDWLSTISLSSQKQILALNPRLEPRITMAYTGIGKQYVPGCEPEPSVHVRTERNGTPLFTSVGSLISRKNFIWLIHLVRTWLDQGREGCLVIVGEGPERSRLEAEIRRLKLEGEVQLAGRLHEEQLIGLLQRSRVFLFPSLMEGFGMAPAEALACGVPVIVSDQGALPEVVKHGKTGFVLPLDRGFEPWIEAMNWLADDERLWQRMRLAAVADVRSRFDWDMNARIVSEGFYRVCARNGLS